MLTSCRTAGRVDRRTTPAATPRGLPWLRTASPPAGSGCKPRLSAGYSSLGEARVAGSAVFNLVDPRRWI
jgi:hypothetical protein